MDDLISKQVAIDSIENIGHIATLPDGDSALRKSAVDYVLRNLPPAQPEIIRCKDCKHRDPEDKKCDCGMQWCVFPKRDDDFCSYAERKTDE